MSVFAGILGYESFWLGAQGWVAVCSNVLPRASADLFTLVADNEDQETALALYRRILPIIRWVGENRYVSATKAALDAMGLPVGDPREPRLPLPDFQRWALEKDLADLGMIGSLKTAFAS